MSTARRVFPLVACAVLAPLLVPAAAGEVTVKTDPALMSMVEACVSVSPPGFDASGNCGPGGSDWVSVTQTPDAIIIGVSLCHPGGCTMLEVQLPKDLFGIVQVK